MNSEKPIIQTNNMTYNEKEVFDTAYWIMMNFDVPKGIESADLQSELLYANNLRLEYVPGYTFTMEEDEEEDCEEFQL